MLGLFDFLVVLGAVVGGACIGYATCKMLLIIDGMEQEEE